MPPLRNSTSFAERIGLARPERSPWKRSLSHPTHLQSPKPKPLPVSEVTKTKLDKFKYHSPETATGVTVPPEENTSNSNSTGTRNIRSRRSGSPTPLTRLDWKDLVEPCDPQADAAERSSPNGKLLWNNKHDAAAFPAISPMMMAGRKRARSSSPPMSPSPADRYHSPVPAVKVNVKQLAEALKSPHPDPTLELWDRYSLRGPEGGQAGQAGVGGGQPTLAQLMVSASPSPRKRGKNVAGEKGDLRRAMSCGLLWPKRRRTERLSADNSGQRELEAASKSSLVSALLDSVTSSIQDQDQDDADLDLDLDAEPALDSPSVKMKKGRAPPPQPAPQPKEPKDSKGSPLSDYGDDDLDDDFLELEAQIQASQRTEGGLPAEEPELPRMPGTEPPRLETSDTTRPLATAKNVNTQAKTQLDELDDFDDFDDDIFDDVGDIFDGLDSTGPAANEPERSNAAKPLHKQRVRSIQRYLIKSVLDGEYVDQWERAVPDKILIIQADNSTESRTVHLRGAWFDTPAHTDCYVHVIGDFSPKGQCIVDDSQNLLILHPDQLVSSTVVADSFGCMRRAVLQDRVKATGEASPPLVYGTMLHEIFQEALLANRWDLAFLARVIDTIIDKHIEDLYTIKVGLASAREHLQSKMTELSFWAKSFVAAEPQADAIVEGRHGEKAKMAVRKLLDVEEHVWSPMYGLKGNIDATVEVMMTDSHKKSQILTVPFEVKTGKHANSNHMAQTALYSLLLSDRYDINITSGILYYMETSRTLRIPAVRHELRHMIMQRNELACYIRERSVQLPPMLKNRHMCGRCYAKTSCFTYHRLADDGDGETSGMGGKFDEAVEHLTPRHREFFIKWENLLTMEEKESQKNKRELWTMTSGQREKRSRCFGDVIIEPGSTQASIEPNDPDARVNRFGYTFVKRNPAPDFTFVGSEITTGEPVVVSDEEGHYALAIGFVTALSRGRISVAVDRRLHNARIRQPGFDEVDNQAFASIMEVSVSKSTAIEKAEEPPLRYRLDRDEFSNGMATVRNNLVQLMANDVPAAAQMRRLIVDLEAPRFKTAPTQYTVTVTDGESLNVDQKRAIEKVMSAQDYALVLGMPGTGKTTTIAHIIRALVSQGKTVLLTSHTHTAVDNILLKLRADSRKTPILRLGAPAKIHPEVRAFVHLAGQPKKTFEEIEQTWHGTPIVATTCLGINHQIFVERAFDYCIVDEASQITLPICAGPIRLARTFVLVGDHNQLPPVVKNGEAREGGLDVSLFKLLSDAHPQSVVNLEHQYRMCEDIMTLSNTLIYEGKLRCGTEALRRKKLHVPNMAALKQHHYDASTILLHQPRTLTFCTGSSSSGSRCWLHDLLDGEARVRFVDTDTIQPPVSEDAQGSRIVNHAEAQIVTQLVESLLTVGVPAAEIGVMTHYRAQLSLLKEKLKTHSAAVEMHTTDRFQGRDKEVVVLSLVRSNEACNIGELLRDWRRINVAFTRAKTKLLVVGSVRTMRGSGEGNMLSRFVGLMEGRDWVYHLPGDALEGHYFEGQGKEWMGTQRVVRKSRMERGERGEAEGKENQRPGVRRVGPGGKVLLKERLITRDILTEMGYEG